MNATRSFFSRRSTLMLSLVAATVLLGAVLTSGMFMPVPEDLNLSLERTTDSGIYSATITPQTRGLKVNQMHSWSITLRSKEGRPVEHATFNVDGGMPQHGHGLPTQPRVTRETAPGTYLLEGMKFSMTGWWVLGLGISSVAGSDTITYNIMMTEEGV